MEDNNTQQTLNRSFQDLLIYGTSSTHLSTNQQGEPEIRRIDPINYNDYSDSLSGWGNSSGGLTTGNGLMSQITTSTTNVSLPNDYNSLTQGDFQVFLSDIQERSRQDTSREFNIIAGQGFYDSLQEYVRTINYLTPLIPKDYKGPIILKFGGTRGNETWDKKKHGKIDKYLKYNSTVIVEIVDEKTNQLIELNGK